MYSARAVSRLSLAVGSYLLLNNVARPIGRMNSPRAQMIYPSRDHVRTVCHGLDESSLQDKYVTVGVTQERDFFDDDHLAYPFSSPPSRSTRCAIRTFTNLDRALSHCQSQFTTVGCSIVSLVLLSTLR